MHGLGNDYIYIDCISHSAPSSPAELSRRLSPRHTAIGADGIILITPSKIADLGMRIFNADGSEAQMCGNGSRCVGKYAYDHALTQKKSLTLETLSGVKHLLLRLGTDGKVDKVTVDMGVPELRADRIPVLSATNVNIPLPQSISHSALLGRTITAVSMGNPHGVIFLEGGVLANKGDEILPTIGPLLEHDAIWPERANIEFAEVEDPQNIRMRVWERGSGETMACGTGACATAVAAILNGHTERRVNVHLRGGTLQVYWNPETGHVEMTGPATEVFNGEVEI